MFNSMPMDAYSVHNVSAREVASKRWGTTPREYFHEAPGGIFILRFLTTMRLKAQWFAVRIPDNTCLGGYDTGSFTSYKEALAYCQGKTVSNWLIVGYSEKGERVFSETWTKKA